MNNMLGKIKQFIKGRMKQTDVSLEYSNLKDLLEELPKDTQMGVDCTSFYGNKFNDTTQKIIEFIDTWFKPTSRTSESFQGRHKVYAREQGELHRINLCQKSSAGTIKGNLSYVLNR